MNKSLQIKQKFKSEKDFLIYKANKAKSDFLKSSNSLAQDLAKICDLKELTQKHPFELTGTAGVIGFIAAGRIGYNKSNGNLDAPAQKNNQETPRNGFIGESIFSLVLALVLDVFKDSFAAEIKSLFSNSKQSHNESPSSSST